jgi:hypothetical protein
VTAEVDRTVGSEYLELVDWRRRVADMWKEWRDGSTTDPQRATETFRAAKDALFRDHPQSAFRRRPKLLPSAPLLAL